MVVIKNLNDSLYTKVLSPIVIDNDDPVFTTYYNKIGSKEGSNT